MEETAEEEICPRMRVKLEKEKDEARNFHPITSGNKFLSKA